MLNIYSVTDIANWFLQKEKTIDQKKLQKLCCYAQAWYVALNSEKLFEENWPNRPTKKLSNDNGDLNFLNEIWEVYGKYNEFTSCLKIDNIYSKENQKNLRNAIKELKEGKFEEHELI